MHMEMADEWPSPWNLRDAWDLANVRGVGMLPPKLDQALETSIEMELANLYKK